MSLFQLPSENENDLNSLCLRYSSILGTMVPLRESNPFHLIFSTFPYDGKALLFEGRSFRIAPSWGRISALVVQWIEQGTPKA